MGRKNVVVQTRPVAYIQPSQKSQTDILNGDCEDRKLEFSPTTESVAHESNFFNEDFPVAASPRDVRLSSSYDEASTSVAERRVYRDYMGSHLDLLEEVQRISNAKDRRIQELTEENETLKRRLERSERRSHITTPVGPSFNTGGSKSTPGSRAGSISGKWSPGKRSRKTSDSKHTPKKLKMEGSESADKASSVEDPMIQLKAAWDRVCLNGLPPLKADQPDTVQQVVEMPKFRVVELMPLKKKPTKCDVPGEEPIEDWCYEKRHVKFEKEERALVRRDQQRQNEESRRRQLLNSPRYSAYVKGLGAPTAPVPVAPPSPDLSDDLKMLGSLKIVFNRAKGTPKSKKRPYSNSPRKRLAKSGQKSGTKTRKSG